MEREKRNSRARKYIRLLMICLPSYSLIFASPSIMNIEYFPKIAYISEAVTVKIYMDSRLNSSPKIMLNDDKVLILETSNIFIENGKTVIENQYKTNKTGFVKLNHILLYIGDKMIAVPPIELKIQANPLSKDTQFRIKMLRYKESENITKDELCEHNAPIILGEQYFILIEGLFEKIGEQKISISYDLPENAFIEKLESYPIEFRQDEIWKPVAMFLWIPLKKGMQALPEFNLTLDINKTQEYKLSLEKLEFNVLLAEKIKQKKDSAKEDFQKKLTKIFEKENTFKQYTKKEIEIATKIRELRKKEYNSFFYLNLKKDREKLEKELNLENTFTVFHYKFYVMSIIIAIVFLSYPICKKIIKKKPFNFYDILSSCIGIFILIYGIKTDDFRKEYTMTRMEENSIYVSPEVSSTILEKLSIGETVKIIHTSKDWYFVETRKNIKGWMQKRGQ